MKLKVVTVKHTKHGSTLPWQNPHISLSLDFHFSVQLSQLRWPKGQGQYKSFTIGNQADCAKNLWSKDPWVQCTKLQLVPVPLLQRKLYLQFSSLRFILILKTFPMSKLTGRQNFEIKFHDGGQQSMCLKKSVKLTLINWIHVFHFAALKFHSQN